MAIMIKTFLLKLLCTVTPLCDTILFTGGKCYEKIYYSADCHGDPAAMPLHLWMDQAGIR